MHKRLFRIVPVILMSWLGVAAILFFARSTSKTVNAAPIPPPVGYPKLGTSSMSVTPTLVSVGDHQLTYRIEIKNTGAYAASGVVFSDTIPTGTTYNLDAKATSTNQPSYANGVLNWIGEVGFDRSVVIEFSVQVQTTFSGTIRNVASINHPSLSQPILLDAETTVTDHPVLSITKDALPAKPGANQPLDYRITVTNLGQEALNLPLTVTDSIPAHTQLLEVGGGGSSTSEGEITWKRNADLPTGGSTVFTFTVQVDDVPSGTVITNDHYTVSSPVTNLVAGKPYTVTVIDPIFLINKEILPDPPGSNRDATYLLTLLNKGSQATDLIVSDRLPSGANYVSGGTYDQKTGLVTWNLPHLNSGEIATVSYTVFIGDVIGVPVINDDYQVCSAEGVCQAGPILSNLVQGPNFYVTGWLDPIAKKPGGGTGPVTPTLVLQNLGPGNALKATARLSFFRISVEANSLISIPKRGVFSPSQTCGDKCLTFLWTGDLAAGESITFTTSTGQSTKVGEEGTIYSASIVVSDTLGISSTVPISTTAIGHVTHLSNLIPSKSAPPVIGAGQILTYTLSVFNSGLSTDVPPYPVLTDTLPLSTTLVSVSDGGSATTVNGQKVISWTLPAMSPGDLVNRSFSVQVDDSLVSGTQVVNSHYGTTWFNTYVTDVYSSTNGLYFNIGTPITTTVKEVGLIDSYKTVSPEHIRPGPGGVLTYTLHVVNSSPLALSGVEVDDILPWEHSTYQRDAIATSGQVISDIVSLHWTGNVAPFATELITFSVLVDPDFSGVLTNTAVITHPDLREPIPITAVAYVTDKPVLLINKTASPGVVQEGGELLYTLSIRNMGELATGLVITDQLPSNGMYISGSASSSGQIKNNILEWNFPVLEAGDERTVTFKVQVTGGKEVINQNYGVTCSEGVSAVGKPVITKITSSQRKIYLPLIVRSG